MLVRFLQNIITNQCSLIHKGVNKLYSSEKPWEKVWPSDVPKKIVYPEISIQGLLSRTAKKFPRKIAIDFNETKISYKQLDLLSNQFALGLTRLGIKKGDCIAIFLPNIPQFIIAYFGILKTGAIVTSISPLYKEREVEYQLNNSGALAIIALQSLYPIIEKIKEKTRLRKIILTDSTWDLSSADSQNNNTRSNVFSFKQIIAKKSKFLPEVKINPKTDIAALQYTGGTTGRSKGAMLTHMNLISNTVMFAEWIKAKTDEKFLTALPLFHIYGMTTSMNVPIYLAATMVLIPKFDPKEVLELIQNKKINIFCGVPTMYSIILANKDIEKYDLTSIRVCISGASPLPPKIQKKFMAITKGFLAEGYGLTEASPVTHCNPIYTSMKTVQIGSIGIPLPDTDAKILDLINHEKELPIGEKGELAISGPQVMLGYWQKPEETKLVLKNKWLLTGDIGKMDDNGYFYITDRKKDLIKYKDYSVYPREIEDVLYENSNVKLCAVVGKPAPIVGEIPKAFVVLKDNAKVDENQIMKFVNDRVAPFKAIREVEFRINLPLSSVGKVLRRLLQKEEKEKIS